MGFIQELTQIFPNKKLEESLEFFILCSENGFQAKGFLETASNTPIYVIEKDRIPYYVTTKEKGWVVTPNLAELVEQPTQPSATAYDNPIYAVVDVRRNNTIRSRWYKVEDGKVQDVTTKFHQDLRNHYQKDQPSLRTPYEYKNHDIIYPFGCGLTHYISNETVQRLQGTQSTHIEVLTAADLKNFGYFEDDWQHALATHLASKRVIEKSAIPKISTVKQSFFTKLDRLTNDNAHGEVLREIAKKFNLTSFVTYFDYILKAHAREGNLTSFLSAQRYAGLRLMAVVLSDTLTTPLVERLLGTDLDKAPLEHIQYMAYLRPKVAHTDTALVADYHVEFDLIQQVAQWDRINELSANLQKDVVTLVRPLMGRFEEVSSQLHPRKKGKGEVHYRLTLPLGVTLYELFSTFIRINEALKLGIENIERGLHAHPTH